MDSFHAVHIPPFRVELQKKDASYVAVVLYLQACSVSWKLWKSKLPASGFSTAVCFAACFTMKHGTACFARFFNICFLRKSAAACFVFFSLLVYIFLSNKSNINAKKRCRVYAEFMCKFTFQAQTKVKISRSSYHSNFENEMNSAIQTLI